MPNAHVIHGDCIVAMKQMPSDSFDAVVTDPPYFLTGSAGTGFMGKSWDSLSPSGAVAAAIFRSMRLDLSTVGEEIAQEDASTLESTKSPSPITPAQFAEQSFIEPYRNLNLGSPSVLGDVITRDEASVLSSVLSPNLTSSLRSLPISVRFVINPLFTEPSAKNIARIVVGILLDDPEWLAQITTFTSTGSIGRSATGAKIGHSLESKSTVEIIGHASDAISDADVRISSVTMSSHTIFQEIIEKLTSSPYARRAIRQCTSDPSFIPSLSEVFHTLWCREVIRVLKPGGYMLAFGGTRTSHRLASAIENAGFEYKDTVCWLYGSGFPKSRNIGKAIDSEIGIEREVVGEWDGWGTALKPAWEPIIMARKPLGESTVAANVLKHGTGAINIDGCRISASSRPLRELDAKPEANGAVYAGRRTAGTGFDGGSKAIGTTDLGRWPANLVLSHSPECQQVGETQVKARVINRFDDGAKPFGDGAGHPYTSSSMGDEHGQETVETWDCVENCAVRQLDEQSGTLTSGTGAVKRATGAGYQPNALGAENRAIGTPMVEYGDTGGASRFFYTSKASPSERNERTRQAGIKNTHPTLKSLDLMRYLCRLVCRPGGRILDPFAGSGTTLVAALNEGMDSVGIEITDEYIPIIHARLDGVQLGGLFD